MRTADPVRVQRIIDTAAGLFADRHYHEVRMDDIAARAGVSKGALYQHFKDKDDLYLALILQGLNRLFDEVRERVAGPKAPEDKLRGFVAEVVRFFTTYPSYLELIQRVEQSQSHQAAALRARRSQFIELLIGVIRELNASGRWTVSNPEFAALALIGMTREVLRWQTPAPPGLFEPIVQLFLHGLSKPGAHRETEVPR
jgi:AcrR family transcriptional regulator